MERAIHAATLLDTLKLGHFQTCVCMWISQDDHMKAIFADLVSL